MQTFFRLTLLGTCAAIGLAVAIAVAWKPDAAESQTPATETVVQDEPSGASDPPPRAAYHPPVANQFDPPEVTQNQVAPAEPLPPQSPAPVQPIETFPYDPPYALQPLPEIGPSIRDVPRGIPRRDDDPGEGDLEALPVPPQGAGGKAIAEIRKNEGDDTLSINVQNSDLREVLKLLSDQGANILASKNVQGNVSATLSNVDLNTALKAILQSTGFQSRREGKFLYVGTPQDFIEMDQLKDRIGTRIYRTNYARAADLSALITPMLTERVGKVTISTPAEMDITPSTTHTGGNSFANEEVVMVRDYEAVLVQVDQIVEEVDRRPQQVLIEAMILTVKLDDRFTLGVDFAALRDSAASRLFTGAPLATLGAIDTIQGGLKFGYLDASLGNFVTALETVGDTNVVASPKLMCLNKQRAEILIGQQLGYISSTVTETATTQSVQFLEVGTQLRIRPFISRDGMIRMEVHPELSTGNVRVVGAFTLPDKVVTQVTTNIMCKDGGTVVIGGLIREDLGSNVNQVPVLGNLPWVGTLFRRSVETITKNEIIVVLTPRIVSDPEINLAGAQEAADYMQRQAVYADKMSPIGKRHYARTHYRFAVSAWESGNAEKALKYINISIQFDPLSLEALRLRNQILGTGSWNSGGVAPAGDLPPIIVPPQGFEEIPAARSIAPRPPVMQARRSQR